MLYLLNRNNGLLEWRKTSEEKVIGGSRSDIVDVPDRVRDSADGRGI